MKKLSVLISVVFLLSSCAKEGGGADSVGAGNGQGGSLARFAVANDHLFLVDGSELKVFDLSKPNNAVYLSRHQLNTRVETIFPRDTATIFIGTVSGMYIYDISNAPNINQLSVYNHITACDPVVANDRYAYVTLRSEQNNNWCWRSVDQLDIIDIQDLSNPKLITSFSMINPRGLGLIGDTLLVCDRGLKVFDVNDPLNLKLLDFDEDFDAVDLIPYGNLVIAVGEDGLKQYEYKNGNLTFLSEL